MQVASNQAVRALAALRAGRRRGGARRRRSRPARPVAPYTIDRALAHIDGLPPVREGQVAAARRRVAWGPRPSADDVADMVVRRALVDQVR